MQATTHVKLECADTLRMIDLYMDGALSEELTKAMDGHLLKCQACAGEMRGLEQTRNLLQQSVTAHDPGPAYRERALARLESMLATHLQPVPGVVQGRQWVLPFAANDEPTSTEL